MSIHEVLPEHTPNEGRQIWNENNQKLLAQLDSLALNVKADEYGAVGDGVVDDLPAIQAAIEACGQNGGGWVFLPSGIYLLKSGSLILRDEVNIIGAGMFNTIIRLGDNVNLPVLSDEGQGPDRDFAFGKIHLANFSVDGNRVGNPEGQEGILTSGYFSFFENLLIHECGTHGIRMGDRKLENASSQNRISGCRIYDCTDTGIYLDVNSIDHNITGNYIYGCDVGIRIRNGGVRVVNNDIYRHATAAIEVDQTSYGLIIASNDINGNKRNAIHISRTTQSTARTWSQFLITGNSILGDGLEGDNQYDAIHVETSVDRGISNLTIASNKIFTLEEGNRYRYGVHLEKNVTDTSCVSNHILRAASSGYFVGTTCVNIEVDRIESGILPAPDIPASGTALLNPFPTTVYIYLSGGSVRNVLLDGAPTGLKVGNFTLPPSKTITLIYDQTPSWVWFSN